MKVDVEEVKQVYTDDLKTRTEKCVVAGNFVFDTIMNFTLDVI